jgi:hypothetical protein
MGLWSQTTRQQWEASQMTLIDECIGAVKIVQFMNETRLRRIWVKVGLENESHDWKLAGEKRK